MENWYKELPEGYRTDRVIDAKEKKTSIILTLCSFALSALAFVPVAIFCNFRVFYDSMRNGSATMAYVVFLFSMVAYIILHELLHGVAYKSLTHQKLTFGFTLTVAFCGVPDIVVSRKTALIALLTPFVTFTVIFIPLLVWLHGVSMVFYTLTGVVFAIHVGGCIGYLYMTCLLLFRYKDPSTLINDTGPRQTIYVQGNQAETI